MALTKERNRIFSDVTVSKGLCRGNTLKTKQILGENRTRFRKSLQDRDDRIWSSSWRFLFWSCSLKRACCIVYEIWNCECVTEDAYSHTLACCRLEHPIRVEASEKQGHVLGFRLTAVKL
jgi:hypothetical protein